MSMNRNFYGLKDVRSLFNQNDDDGGICKKIEYLFNEKDVTRMLIIMKLIMNMKK